MAFQSRPETCNIRVSATDPFGKEIRDYELALRRHDNGALPTSTSKSEFEGVPFGEYVLMVRTGCCRVERNLIANVPRLWVRVGVPIRFGDAVQPGGDLIVNGSIRPWKNRSEGLWVRIRGTFLDISREAEIDDSGHFSVSGLDMGTYMVEVLRRAKIVYSRQIEIDTNRPITNIAIDLQQSK